MANMEPQNTPVLQLRPILMPNITYPDTQTPSLAGSPSLSKLMLPHIPDPEQQPWDALKACSGREWKCCTCYQWNGHKEGRCGNHRALERYCISGGACRHGRCGSCGEGLA
ncbi:hypothetical protein BDZ45DRAFT_625955, partial [Acephala macrosclerotiorum]